MTDAFTGYDPTTTWLNPDNGTNMVTLGLGRIVTLLIYFMRESRAHSASLLLRRRCGRTGP
jgi:hypothetical protein